MSDLTHEESYTAFLSDAFVFQVHRDGARHVLANFEGYKAIREGGESGGPADHGHPSPLLGESRPVLAGDVGDAQRTSTDGGEKTLPSK